MTYEERLYDRQLDYIDKPANYPVCPECGAVLDSEDDKLVVAAHGDHIYGCTRCLREREPIMEVV